MRHMNQKAARTFRKLIDGLGDFEAKKIGDGATYMTVHVEHVRTVELGRIFSVAHYYRQNGDSICDPDMTFLVAETDNGVYPLTFEQGGRLYQDAVEWDGGKVKAYRPKMQRDMAVFAGTWMENIRTQQRI